MSVREFDGFYTVYLSLKVYDKWTALKSSQSVVEAICDMYETVHDMYETVRDMYETVCDMFSYGKEIFKKSSQ